MDATGRTINFTYSNGQVSRITALGRVFDFSYAGGSNDQSITNITYPVLDTDPSARRNREFSYTSSNSWSKQIASETDLRGKDWNYSYVNGKCVSFIQPTPHPSAAGKTYVAHRFAYGATQATAAIAWTLNQFEDPLPTITHTYVTGDPRQRPLQSETDELGYSVTYLFGSKMGAEVITDRRGKLWTYTYDDLANVTSSTTPTGEHEYSTYNADSDLTETWNDQLSSHTKFSYSNGVLNGAYEPIGNVLRGLYNASVDAYGLPTSVSNYANQGARTFSIGYDAHGSVANFTDPYFKTTTVEVNTIGQPTQVTDALNHSATLTYDSWGRPWKSTYADGSTIQVVYDGEGNVVSVTDERGKTSSWTYDGVGNVLTYTNARGDLESYLYNYRSQLIRVTDGNGHARSYTLNNRGDVEKLTLADNTEERWTYDGEGNVLTYTPGHVSGPDFIPEFTIGYEYDSSGRPTKVDYPTGTDTTFSYSNFGSTIGMTDDSGNTTWAYNGRGNLSSLITPQGNFSYTYDSQSSERLTMTAAGIGTYTYEYDGLGRVKKLTNYRNEITQWAFDDAGRTTQRTLHNGDKEDFAYDIRDRLTGVTLKKADQTLLRSQTYGYDAASNVVNHTIDGITTAYGYDNINQLTSEIQGANAVTYTFDANGNRLTRTGSGPTFVYSYDAGDKLTVRKAVVGSIEYVYDTFAYDGIGRMTSRTAGSYYPGPSSYQYVYDYESRLSQVWMGGEAPISSYGYNGLDARVSRTTNTASYTYRRAGAYVTDPVVSDGSATFTPGISEYRGGYSRYFSGGLKNFDTVTGSSGSVAGKRRYDAYGNSTLISGGWYGTFGHAGGFGYQEDSESGLHLLGHRYYDSGLGRFMTRDPSKAGRNWLSYCSNNPTAQTDPTGLRSIGAWSGVQALAGTDELLVYQSVRAAPPAWQASWWKALMAWASAVGLGGAGLFARPGTDYDQQDDPYIYRRGKSPERTNDLAGQAAAAESYGFGYGVSGNSTPPPVAHRKARLSNIIAAGFSVDATPTNRFIDHVTIRLPKPVDAAVTRRFNDTFKRMRSHLSFRGGGRSRWH